MKRDVRGGGLLGKALRAFLFLLIIPVLAALPRGSLGAEKAPDALCDLNGDGRISAADAAVLLRALDGRIALPVAEENADPTQSGTMDETDARVILCLATGRIPSLPAFVERVSTGLCHERLFDRFSYTGTRRDGANYQSDSVCVTLEQLDYEDAVVYLADIYVQELACFATAFADKFEGRNAYADVIAAKHNAIIAISGDYYATDQRGPIVRNGVWYRKTARGDEDVCTLGYDGILRVYTEGDKKGAALLGTELYQCWMFGPALLDEQGAAMTAFNSKLTARNPRAALGYYEPGHYCFLVADGRQSGYSRGLTLRALSALFAELGCAAAYNLDGGQTAIMATAEARVNQPTEGGRVVSDILYIWDAAAF